MTSYVTSGEGAESDDDVNQSLSFMKNTMVTSTMVSGEASETDEEDDDDDDTADQQVNQDKQSTPPAEPYGDAIPMMIDSFEIDETLDSKHGKGRRQKLVFKYDSKLRERNLQMRSSLVEGSMQIYTSGSDKLLSSTYYLTKAQAAVEDVAFQSKVILEDLGSLDNALQDIRDLRFLPTLTSTHHTS